jgi:hypothetical protein
MDRPPFHFIFYFVRIVRENNNCEYDEPTDTLLIRVSSICEGTLCLELQPYGKYILCVQRDFRYGDYGSRRILKIEFSKFLMIT